MEMESVCSNGLVLDDLLCSVGQVLVAEAAIAAAKSIAFSFLLVCSLLLKSVSFSGCELVFTSLIVFSFLHWGFYIGGLCYFVL